MEPGKNMSLTDLNDLFWQNKNALSQDEQRLFQAILLELAKGPALDAAVLERLMLELGQRSGLSSESGQG